MLGSVLGRLCPSEEKIMAMDRVTFEVRSKQELEGVFTDRASAEAYVLELAGIGAGKLQIVEIIPPILNEEE